LLNQKVPPPPTFKVRALVSGTLTKLDPRTKKGTKLLFEVPKSYLTPPSTVK